MNSALQTALHSWTPPLVTIAALLALAALYARGFARLQRQMPRRFAAWRLASFLAGIATLLVAIASPLEALDDLLLQVHMTQHLILMMLAPALLLAGAPAIPLAARLIAAHRQGRRRPRAPRAPRPPRIRLAHQPARMLDRIRRRHLVLAHPRDLSARAPLRRLARRRARMLFHYGSDVLVSGHPAVAGHRAMAAMGNDSVSAARRRPEHDPRRALHVLRPRNLSLLCGVAANRGLHSPWRPDCRRRYHVGARLDFLPGAGRAHHVPDALPAKPSSSSPCQQDFG